ncbi:Thymidylate kinase [Rhynchospora pubera]|uniref:Thymidylate kinase n=1 Tax=Rhynchospora pubera TaxID=906938 RepID=A0AAV8EMV5_9POAL|nr:Thymidylate kinase [Rhynchospora pubera]
MTILGRITLRAVSLNWISRAGFSQPTKRPYKSIKMGSTEDKTSMARGSLIVLEGLDRSGKSSQCSKLLSYLQSNGLSVEAWRFPDITTGIGQMISSYLLNESQLDDRAIHLLFSANRWEKRALMEKQAKKWNNPHCRPAPEEGLIAPDLVLYLDIPPEELRFVWFMQALVKAAERGGYGTERYEKLEFQKKVAEYYYALRDSSWEVVDGCLKMETVEEKLRELAMNCILKCLNGKPLVNLWSGN